MYKLALEIRILSDTSVNAHPRTVGRTYVFP